MDETAYFNVYIVDITLYSPCIVIPARRLMNFKEINLMMISFDDHISSFIIVIIARLARRRGKASESNTL